jgi:hypothetical protein
MKRYLVFSGQTYYPSGGWEDFIGSFDTPEEAEAARRIAHDPKPGYPWDHWSEIVDRDTQKAC